RALEGREEGVVVHRGVAQGERHAALTLARAMLGAAPDIGARFERVDRVREHAGAKAHRARGVAFAWSTFDRGAACGWGMSRRRILKRRRPTEAGPRSHENRDEAISSRSARSRSPSSPGSTARPPGTRSGSPCTAK